MVLCLLARHASHGLLGHTLVGRGDVPLDATGRDEAHRLAAALTGRGVSHIQSSPRRRAFETARPIAEQLKLGIDIAPALDELDYGHWTGCRFGALAGNPEWEAWNSDRSIARPPAGESAAALKARVVAHLRNAARYSAGACVLMVSHAEPIRAAVLHARGISLDRWAEVDVAPASVVALEVSAGRIALASKAPATDSAWSSHV